MENLKLLSKIALSFQDLSNFHKDMNNILDEIGKHLDVSRIYVFLKEDGTIKNEFEWWNEGIDPKRDELKIDHEVNKNLDDRLRGKRYISSNHRTELSDIVKEKIKKYGIKALLVFPIIIEEKVQGFISIDESRYDRQWTDEEIEILETISAMTAGAYKRKFMQESLEVSYNNLNNLFETIGDSLIVSDLDGNIIDGNDTLARRVGYSMDELKKMNIRDLNPNKLAKNFDNIKKNLISGSKEEYSFRVKTKRGRINFLKAWNLGVGYTNG